MTNNNPHITQVFPNFIQ